MRGCIAGGAGSGFPVVAVSRGFWQAAIPKRHNPENNKESLYIAGICIGSGIKIKLKTSLTPKKP
jgi:hypothetical protein